MAGIAAGVEYGLHCLRRLLATQALADIAAAATSKAPAAFMQELEERFDREALAWQDARQRRSFAAKRTRGKAT